MTVYAVTKMRTLRYFTVFFAALMALLLPARIAAQVDPFGTTDVVYGDSLSASRGETVPVQFHLKNDEQLGSLSIPITYDPALLTLTDISFAGSRGEYLETKLINPSDPTNADGHFLVGLIQVTEDPLPVGDGLLFTASFLVSDTAPAGTITLLDSLFYPPAGELLLVEAFSATSIRPAFTPATIHITGDNRPPALMIDGPLFVLEGDSLKLDIVATDPDNDDVTLAITEKPTGVSFASYDGGGGASLTWVPDFVGPFSADGSPFTLTVRASDGDLTIDEQITVEVVNNNRAPDITLADSVVVDAGDALALSVRAFDPDFEDVTWNWTTSLSGANFDGANPGELTWQSGLTDSGTASATFIATDPAGFADTSTVAIRINPATIYTLTLDTLEVSPGENFSYDISLENQVPVSGFELVINYDPTLLTLNVVEVAGTRAESFEYFNTTQSDNGVPGNLRLEGLVSTTDPSATIPSGDGPIARLLMRASGDIVFSGMTLPIRFRFPAGDPDVNTLSDTLGNTVDAGQITYHDGFVRIEDVGQVRIGDINLNGIVAEISDAIYFTNYIIDPSKYPFSPIQYANSDVNRDNILASISDLVALVNLVINNSSAPAVKLNPADHLQAKLFVRKESNRSVVAYDTDFPVGGLAFTVRGASVNAATVQQLAENMTLDLHQVGDEVRGIIYSLDGAYMPDGEIDLIAVDGEAELELIEVDISTADGRYVAADIAVGSNVPADYRLDQNYPNPFNPTTTIGFSLPNANHVRLTVYNVLGQAVTTLVDEHMPAGDHTVSWDGRNDYGESAASGVYLYRLEADAVVLTKKMMFLK